MYRPVESIEYDNLKRIMLSYFEGDTFTEKNNHRAISRLFEDRRSKIFSEVGRQIIANREELLNDFIQYTIHERNNL